MPWPDLLRLADYRLPLALLLYVCRSALEAMASDLKFLSWLTPAYRQAALPTPRSGCGTLCRAGQIWSVLGKEQVCTGGLRRDPSRGAVGHLSDPPLRRNAPLHFGLPSCLEGVSGLCGGVGRKTKL